MSLILISAVSRSSVMPIEFLRLAPNTDWTRRRGEIERAAGQSRPLDRTHRIIR